MRGITPAVKFLLILNVVIFLIEAVFSIPLSYWFALNAEWWTTFSFGQLFTYMFVHSHVTLSHIVMNMLGLFFLGPAVERTLGSYRFFTLYYLSGILGGLGWSLLAREGQYCVGASGAIMGILGAFAALYPNAKLYVIFFPFRPFTAWKLVLAFACFEFFQTFIHPVFGGIANSAHLMGGIAGFCYAYSLKHPDIVQKLESRIPFGKKGRPQARRSTSSGATLSKSEIDHILDKIGKQGMGALTSHERELLKRATRG